jgi:hypothetical protein
MSAQKEWLVFYTTCGDGCTFSFDKFIPFQYSSKKDAEDLLFEYAFKLLEKYIECLNNADWHGYSKWLTENKFFDTWEFEFTDLWYFKETSTPSHRRAVCKTYKTSDYEICSFQIYTLQEWAEANEETVKYLQKAI